MQIVCLVDDSHKMSSLFALKNKKEIKVFSVALMISVLRVNPKDAKHNNCILLCLLSVTLKVIVANSVDPDQTAPLGAVWSGPILFAYINAKSMFEKFARRCSRQHKEMTFSAVVFLGILRVNAVYPGISVEIFKVKTVHKI